MSIIDRIQAFLNDEEGASGIEYALIAVMVAVVIAGFTTDIKKSVSDIFTSVKTGLTPK